MSNTVTTVPSSSSNTPNTQSWTRIQQPRRKWGLRVFWLVMMAFNVVVFINGFTVLHTQTYWRSSGMRLVPEAEGRWLVTSLTVGEAAANGVRVGDLLLAVNGQPFTPDRSDRTSEFATYTVQMPGEAPREVRLQRQFSQGIMNGGLTLGLSEETARFYLLVMETISFGVCLAVAVLVFLLRSDDWLALFVTWALTIAGCAFGFSFFAADLPHFPIANVVHIYGSIAFPVAILAFVFFPSGLIRPRWAWVPVPIYGVALIALAALAIPDPLAFGLPNLLIMIYAAGLTTYNYQKNLTAIERQQTKWVVFGVLGFAVSVFLRLSVQIFYATLPYDVLSVYEFFVRPLEVISLLTLPIGLAFSILRYRLWDVDVVLNRSLVGGLVTVIVVAIYALAFVILRPILQAIFGQADSVAPLLVSAVISGALFTPIRQQVRHWIDRNVYGLRYDLNQIRRAQVPVAAEESETLILPVQPRPENPGVYTGRTFDGWQLQGVIGRGGMGEVYKGLDDRQRHAAIKVLTADLMTQQEYRTRFAREAETLQALDHPQIVKLLGYGQTPDAHYLAMEFVEGEELSRFMRRNGACDLATAQAILTDIAAALDYAHQRGFVHRDIKPSNIMLRTDSTGKQEAVLMDFGIAKIQDAQTRYTGSGAIGTIDYMAPEQIVAAREVDRRADVYALGIVAYELLTGERPFKGGAAQVLFAHIQQPAPDPRTVLPSLPKPLAAVVLRALEKNAAARYASAGEFVRALTAAV